MNSKSLTVIVILSILLLASLVARNADLTWMALPFLAYLGIGIAQSTSASKVSLEARRVVEPNPAGELPTFEVSLTVTNRSQSIGLLYLSDLPQPGMVITGGSPKQYLALRTGESASMNYVFQATRGHFDWETVQAVVSDPLGLVGTTLELPAGAELQVQPDLVRYRPIPLQPQRTLHSAGSIPARLAGSGTDFWGVREYHPGDSLRRLDWRLTARHPRQFFTKEFEQEEIADIGLILDARQKTDLRIGEDSLFEHSARATASLAEVFLRQGNRVSLLIFGDPRISIFPGYGKVQLNKILRALTQVTTASEGSFEGLQNMPVQMFSSHSLILVLSPLAASDWLLFPRLRAHGYQVLLISPDPLDFSQRMLAKDKISVISSRLAGIERRLEINKITQLWIPVIDWKVSQPLAPLVRNAMSRPHIQQER